jgi:manganese efflux pump family protein
MPFLEILILSLGLAADATAVALCTGASGYASTFRPAARLAFHFGFFQAAMPVIGWVAGSTIASLVGSVDHWLAFLLLGFVAARMIRSGLGWHPEDPGCDPTRGRELVMLSLATSIDALAVGFSIALLGVPVLVPALTIGLVTFLLSLAATQLGRQAGRAFGKRMEILGGIVLLLIGVRILLTHLLPV